MMLNLGFKLNIQQSVKHKIMNKPKVSRLCAGEIIEIDNTLKVKLSLRNDPDYPDFVVIPLTENSLSLKGKTIIFSKTKDKLGHYTCIIRDVQTATNSPGNNDVYAPFRPGNIISGYVYSNQGKLEFNYEKFIKLSENGRVINVVKIDDKKPLFKT